MNRYIKTLVLMQSDLIWLSNIDSIHVINYEQFLLIYVSYTVDFFVNVKYLNDINDLLSDINFNLLIFKKKERISFAF